MQGYDVWLKAFKLDATQQGRVKALVAIPECVLFWWWAEGVPPTVEAATRALEIDILPEELYYNSTTYR